MSQKQWKVARKLNRKLMKRNQYLEARVRELESRTLMGRLKALVMRIGGYHD